MSTARGLSLILFFLAPLVAHASSFPGGILDTTGKTVFVATENGIEALDLATGIARWRSKNADRPLVVAGDQLYALTFSRGSMTIVGLDLAGKGARAFRSEVISLPVWVDASVLRCEWKLDKKSLRLHWHARGSMGRSASGRHIVNLVMGRVTKEGEESKEPPLAIPRMLEKLPVRWHRAFAGQVYAVLEEDVVTSSLLRRQKKLVLRSWDERSSKESKAVDLLRATRPTILASLDGMHVWARESALLDSAERLPWQVFSGLDGHLVTRVPFIAGTTKGTIHNARAYGLATHSGRSLRLGKAGRSHELYAIDLESSKVLWRRVVLEPISQESGK